MGTPISKEMLTEMTPAIKEACVPQITRDKTSRPISSVPNQCAALGALRMALQLVAIGSCGEMKGANRANKMKPTTTAKPNNALGLLRKRSQAA
jgi:hypothetical protein